MKTYNYEFATEDKEIEISEEWMKVLEDLDRQEYNNNQAETRRHSSYSYGDDAEWLAIDETDIVLDRIEAGRLLSKASEYLTDTQLDVFIAIAVKEHTFSSYARETGIAKQNVRKNYLNAVGNIKKYLKISG